MTTTTSTLDTPRPRISWLTTERLAYGLLILVPAIIRLVNLGERTISPIEASTALRAWQASQGMHPALDAGSPLLFSLQSLTFFVMGATDALARAWPLLAISALPMAFYFLRGWLGRWPALLAATLITFSPLANAFARRSDGTGFALLAAAIALVGWSRVQGEQRHGWALILSGLALALLAGPAGFTILVALAILFLLTRGTSSEHRLGPASGDWIVFGVLLLAGGTAFLTRFDALGLMTINLTQWLTDLSLASRNLLLGFIRMAADEPTLSLFGLLAIIWGLRQDRQTRALSIAAAVAALIAILQGPDVAYSRAAAAFFLALPTADLLVNLARRGDFSFRSLEQILFVAVLILLAFLSVDALVSFVPNGDFDQLTLFFLSLLLGLIVILLFLWFLGLSEVRGGLLITGLALTLLFGASMLWQLGFNDTLPTLARVSPTEALPDAKDLIRTYGDLSEHQQGDRWATEVVLIPGSRSDDVIQWYLRRAENFHIAPSVNVENPPAILIAPADYELSLDDAYAGQRFTMLSSWDIGLVESLSQGIQWFFFRRAPFPPPAADAVTLWTRLDLLNLDQNSN